MTIRETIINNLVRGINDTQQGDAGEAGVLAAAAPGNKANKLAPGRWEVRVYIEEPIQSLQGTPAAGALGNRWGRSLVGLGCNSHVCLFVGIDNRHFVWS